MFGGDLFCQIVHVFCDIKQNLVRYHNLTEYSVQFFFISERC